MFVCDVCCLVWLLALLLFVSGLILLVMVVCYGWLVGVC